MTGSTVLQILQILIIITDIKVNDQVGIFQNIFLPEITHQCEREKTTIFHQCEKGKKPSTGTHQYVHCSYFGTPQAHKLSLQLI